MCDNTGEDGYPLVESRDECHTSFVWASKFSCRHCLKQDTENVVGNCVWSERLVQKESKSECSIFSEEFYGEKSVLNEYETIKFYTEECTVLDRRNIFFAVIVFYIFTILFVSMCLAVAYKHRRLRNQYERLSNPNEVREVELEDL